MKLQAEPQSPRLSEAQEDANVETLGPGPTPLKAQTPLLSSLAEQTAWCGAHTQGAGLRRRLRMESWELLGVTQGGQV